MLINESTKDLEAVIEATKVSTESTIGNVSTIELADINNKIRDLQKEMVDLHAKKTSGRIIPDAYAKQGSKLASTIDELNRRKEGLLFNESKSKEIKKRIEEAVEALNTLKLADEFNPQIFRTLIDNIIIKNRNELTFNFKVGYSTTIIVPIK